MSDVDNSCKAGPETLKKTPLSWALLGDGDKAALGCSVQTLEPGCRVGSWDELFMDRARGFEYPWGKAPEQGLPDAGAVAYWEQRGDRRGITGLDHRKWFCATGPDGMVYRYGGADNVAPGCTTAQRFSLKNDGGLAGEAGSNMGVAGQLRLCANEGYFQVYDLPAPLQELNKATFRALREYENQHVNKDGGGILIVPRTEPNEPVRFGMFLRCGYCPKQYKVSGPGIIEAMQAQFPAIQFEQIDVTGAQWLPIRRNPSSRQDFALRTG